MHPCTQCQLIVPFLLTRVLNRKSTLFPYTTLFRSRVFAHSGRTRANGELRWRGGWLAPSVRAESDRRDTPADSDRKSTRLNSSHRCISYAVFCLKKKNRPHSFMACQHHYGSS